MALLEANKDYAVNHYTVHIANSLDRAGDMATNAIALVTCH